jgi:hypothetical protein
MSHVHARLTNKLINAITIDNLLKEYYRYVKKVNMLYVVRHYAFVGCCLRKR